VVCTILLRGLEDIGENDAIFAYPSHTKRRGWKGKERERGVINLNDMHVDLSDVLPGALESVYGVNRCLCRQN
jgi:hypothetical protein